MTYETMEAGCGPMKVGGNEARPSPGCRCTADWDGEESSTCIIIGSKFLGNGCIVDVGLEAHVDVAVGQVGTHGSADVLALCCRRSKKSKVKRLTR